MKKTIFSPFGFLLFFRIDCSGSKEQIFNVKYLSNRKFVFENNAVDAAEVYRAKNGELYVNDVFLTRNLKLTEL